MIDIDDILGELIKEMSEGRYQIGKYNQINGTDLIVLKQNSSYWWVQVPTPPSMGIPSNRKRLSTKIKIGGADSFYKAAKFGLMLIFKNEVLEQENIPLYEIRPTVESVAIKTIEQINELKNKKKIHMDYIRILKSEIIPQLGKVYFKNLTLKDFDLFFRNKVARSSTRITLAKTAINKMYNYAELNNIIRKRDRIDLNKLDIEVDKTPEYVCFRDEDINLMNKKIDSFIDGSRNRITKENRSLFKFYINLLKTTGIRTGEEANGIRWKHIYSSTVKGNRIILKIEKGKNAVNHNKTREICIDKDTIVNLTKLLFFQTGYYKIVDNINKESGANIPYHAGITGMKHDHLISLIELLNISNKPIFARSEIKNQKNKKLSKYTIPNFIDVFDQFKTFLNEELSDEGLTLYSFRHYFITDKLINSVEIHHLAKYCGTSVEMIEKHYSKLKSRLSSEFVLKDLDLDAYKI